MKNDALTDNHSKTFPAHKRLRVLISAHEFSPERGSECAVGWNIVTRLAQHHDVTVLCADGPALYSNAYYDEVTNYFNLHGEVPNLRVVYVRQPSITLRYARINRKLMKFTRGIGWQALYYMGLDGWHRAALQKAKKLGLDNFDLVHQLTPISFLRPGYLWATGLPFFWGPVGGMFTVPFDFARIGGLSSLVFETIRSGNIALRTRLSGRFSSAIQAAKHIWAVSENEAKIINRKSTASKVSTMVDTAPPPEINGYVRHFNINAPLRICWAGRHEASKALPLVLRAIDLLEEKERIMVDILGEGRETERWQFLAKKLSLRNITWHGLLTYHKALQTMGQSDILVHSSFREAASMVVLEALGWGMPVICHDACGMAVAVDDTCGIKIPFRNPDQSIKGFHDAIKKILDNPGLVKHLSKGALHRAAELSWDAKVQEIAQAYACG